MDFDYSVVANEHGFYCMPDHYLGRDITDILASGGVYEPATLNFLSRHLGHGDVVSGGAFIGDFLPALRRAMAPNTMLHTFEPVPTSFQAAQKTIALNKLTGVTIHPVGVGEDVSKMPLLVKRPSGKAISAGERVVETLEADGDRVLEIDIQTLDMLVPEGRPVSLIHLDVEGFEPAAVTGARRIISEYRPMVVTEGEKAWKTRAILNLLNDHYLTGEYKLMGAIENNSIFVAQ
ncbi:FkbM family methyltransferase [Pseudooceanicola sp. MF1-13]|uniref:FkbM family methyltransferase n=1 Tax=Pseudooceanicola sp. MF1-13 TaxID=3379095 RepID=UPI0038913EC1